MPGKRFNFKITAGPFKGRRARLLKQIPETGRVIAEVQGQPAIPATTGQYNKSEWSFDPAHLKAIPNKPPRRRRKTPKPKPERKTL